MDIGKKSFTRYMGAATPFAAKARFDPFVKARLRIALLFVLAGVAVSVIVNGVIDDGVRNSFYQAARSETGAEVDVAYAAANERIIQGRVLRLTLFVIAVYFASGAAMRPIRQSVDRQRRFVAVANHELRTPLAVIRAGAEIAMVDPSVRGNRMAAETFGSILEESDRMTRTIEFLKAFADFDERAMKARMARMNLTAAAAEVVESFRKSGAGGSVDLRFESEGPVFILGDVTAIGILLQNLLQNGIQHTPDGRRVTARVWRRNAQAVLTVEDEGPGIAQEELKLLFEPFYKGRAEKARSGEKSMGLGLNIVKEIAGAHHAEAVARNRPQGGALFEIAFRAV